jgi:hypothetical protein
LKGEESDGKGGAQEVTTAWSARRDKGMLREERRERPLKGMKGMESEERREWQRHVA